MSKTQQGFSTRELKKIFSIVFVAYMVLAVAFYFLAGEQLRYRDSRGNIEMPVANAATVELTAGSVVEQQFTPKIQIFEHLSVQWGVFNRVNHGTVNVQLVDLATQEVLLDQNLQADQITEGQITTFDFPALETVCNAPLALRITSPDAVAGDALTPVMKTDATLENGQLYINGQAVDGELTFSATGRDYIWTGLHYWQFAAAGAVILAVLTFMIVSGHRKIRYLFMAAAGLVPLYVILTIARSHDVTYLNGIFEMKNAATPIFITQPYMYIANNYDNFDCLVRELPAHSMGLKGMFPLWALSGLKFIKPALVDWPIYVNKEELTTVTLFYDAYYDFGIAGVFLFSSVLGAAAAWLSARTYPGRNPAWYLFYSQGALYFMLSFFTTWYSNPTTWFYFVVTGAFGIFLEIKHNRRRRQL